MKDKRIEKPLLCYGESAWGFAMRMAANLQTCLYPDMASDHIAVSMGVKEGRLVDSKDITSESWEIKKYKGENPRVEYTLQSYCSYRIGDRIELGNRILTLYEKKAVFQHGELIFHFKAAEKKDIQEMYHPYQNENIVGLSLTGIVKRYENFKLYIGFATNIQGVGYAFDWYPETGNALYAIPEEGEKAELYMFGAEQGEMYIIRTIGSKGNDARQKKLETGKACVALSDGGVAFKVGDMLLIEDKRLKLNTSGGINLCAAGGIILKARNIRMNSKEEISYVSE